MILVSLKSQLTFGNSPVIVEADNAMNTNIIQTILLAFNAILFLYSLGLSLSLLCWKKMQWDERLAIAPFVSIAFIIFFMKVVQQFFGVWIASLPHPWLLIGMNAITFIGVMVLLKKIRSERSSRVT